uniref:Retrotransposon gag domain-containing protein n=1 Tax=Ananas comosus var. bracteatus TaxID=296719 RepID=A0A6V7P9Q7_ANACO|nr:unnamed protein product [Ananas comosus var. bracteatus]
MSSWSSSSTASAFIFSFQQQQQEGKEEKKNKKERKEKKVKERKEKKKEIKEKAWATSSPSPLLFGVAQEWRDRQSRRPSPLRTMEDSSHPTLFPVVGDRADQCGAAPGNPIRVAPGSIGAADCGGGCTVNEGGGPPAPSTHIPGAAEGEGIAAIPVTACPPPTIVPQAASGSATPDVSAEDVEGERALAALIKFNKFHPPTFEGEKVEPEMVESWIDSMETLCDDLRTLERDKVYLATHCLEKAMKVWWKRVKRDRLPAFRQCCGGIQAGDIRQLFPRYVEAEAQGEISQKPVSTRIKPSEAAGSTEQWGDEGYSAHGLDHTRGGSSSTTREG